MKLSTLFFLNLVLSFFSLSPAMGWILANFHQEAVLRSVERAAEGIAKPGERRLDDLDCFFETLFCQYFEAEFTDGVRRVEKTTASAAGVASCTCNSDTLTIECDITDTCTFQVSCGRSVCANGHLSIDLDIPEGGDIENLIVESIEGEVFYDDVDYESERILVDFGKNQCAQYATLDGLEYTFH